MEIVIGVIIVAGLAWVLIKSVSKEKPADQPVAEPAKVEEVVASATVEVVATPEPAVVKAAPAKRAPAKKVATPKATTAAAKTTKPRTKKTV